MKFFNTLTRRKEEIRVEPQQPVRLYTCGPTVYNYTHIGNLTSYVFADVLRRALIYTHHNAKWVMNITDIEDKIIKAVREEYGDSATADELKTFTDKYTNIFYDHMREVGVDVRELMKAEVLKVYRVTEILPEIQDFILKLMEQEYAYQTSDGVYFDIKKYQEKFGDYGNLVGEGFMAGKKVGARVKVDDYEKEDLSDFVLWKNWDEDDAQIYWDHPKLGKGRSGWHIECSVINKLGFKGETTDIHTGGVDLIFPHHTNEIAQSQPLQKDFVRMWIHCEHLMVDGKKMAKRLKNFYTLPDISEWVMFPGLSLRYLCLQSHYRTQMNFTRESLVAASRGLLSLYRSLMTTSEESAQDSLTAQYKQDFKSALEDDLNTPKALATLHMVATNNELSPGEKGVLMREFMDVLGIYDAGVLGQFVNVPQEVKDMVNAREEARREKDFAKADKIRDEIGQSGYIIEDTPDGALVLPK